MSGTLAERLAALRERIADAARRSGRTADDVTLVGACKTVPAARVIEAVQAGLTHLGENYVQEAAAKISEVNAALPAPPQWHLIGSLQRNKAKDAVRHFSIVETLDRLSLARELDKRARAAGRSLPVLLQVNLSREEQKSGALEEDLPALLEACAGLEALEVRGLMTVPALDPDPERSRASFAALHELRERLRSQPGGEALAHLSMGMSADFEVAIEEGATLVRVGTAIFGPRRS
jgi:pyridoxal phosphate enzyme (YggS family)